MNFIVWRQVSEYVTRNKYLRISNYKIFYLRRFFMRLEKRLRSGENTKHENLVIAQIVINSDSRAFAEA